MIVPCFSYEKRHFSWGKPWKNPTAFNSLACDASISVISERKHVRLPGEFQDKVEVLYHTILDGYHIPLVGNILLIFMVNIHG